jgi:hypothetical protein
MDVRIVRGCPDDAEIAALTVALALCAAELGGAAATGAAAHGGEPSPDDVVLPLVRRGQVRSQRWRPGPAPAAPTRRWAAAPVAPWVAAAPWAS